MNILDWIKSILSNGKKNAKFYIKTLEKPFGDTTPLEIGLYDGNNPIPNEEIGIQINNGKQYIKTTDNDGIARLNINLGVGHYTAKVYWKGSNEFNNLTAYCEIFITIATRMEGTNINMTQGDGTKYQCAIYRQDNQQRIKEEVNITINNKTYTKQADDEGLYKLNLNLPTGTYTIKAEYKGNTIYKPSIIENTITIKPPISSDKKQIILGCDANTSDDPTVQNSIAERLEQEGYPVEKLDIGPNYFASYDYSSNSKGKIGIYLIASGIFSIADAYYGSGQFDNYIFGIRGDFGDKGATCFDCPIRADADCTSICNELDGKTFNQMNSMLQPYVAICGGANPNELADNIIDWLNALEHKNQRPLEQEKSRNEKLLDYFESKAGQPVEYIDDALAIIQGKGYSFYFSDIFDMYETIDKVFDEDGSNCYDIAEVFYHLALGINEKYGRDYEVQYLDVWCPVSGYDHIRLRLRNGPNGDWWYRDPACVLDGGDVTDNWCGTSDNILEVNPSFIYDGD